MTHNTQNLAAEKKANNYDNSVDKGDHQSYYTYMNATQNNKKIEKAYKAAVKSWIRENDQDWSPAKFDANDLDNPIFEAADAISSSVKVNKNEDGWEDTRWDIALELVTAWVAENC